MGKAVELWQRALNPPPKRCKIQARRRNARPVTRPAAPHARAQRGSLIITAIAGVVSVPSASPLLRAAQGPGDKAGTWHLLLRRVKNKLVLRRGLGLARSPAVSTVTNTAPYLGV